MSKITKVFIYEHTLLILMEKITIVIFSIARVKKIPTKIVLVSKI